MSLAIGSNTVVDHSQGVQAHRGDDVQIKGGSGQHGLEQIRGTIASPPEKDLSKFTTWGNGLSLGRVIGSAVRLPGRALVELGKLGESSNNCVARGIGKGIGFLGNVVSVAGGLVGHGVTLAERAVVNTFKGLGGLALTLVGLGARIFGNKSILEKGTSLIKDAWMTRGETQKTMTPEKAAQIKPLAKLMQVTGSSSTQKLPDGFQPLKREEIPARFQRNYVEPAPGDPNNKAMIRSNKLTSALEVSVSKGPDGKVYVAFKGTDGKRPGTWAADALGAFGVADSSFRMARDLVKEMVAMHGAENVHVVGHSLGGALAQFAGIKAGVPVTCFNSMGLPGHLCDKLIDLRELGSGQSKLKQAHVEHINSEGDALSQKLQTRYLPFGLTQVGERYKVEGASGHSINAKNGLLFELNKLAPDQA